MFFGMRVCFPERRRFPRLFIREVLALLSFLIGVMYLPSCSQSGSDSAQISLDTPLRIGVLNTRGALPLAVARDLGYYTEEGVKVELIPFQSIIERDAAFKAGSIDGMVSDLVEVTLLFAKGQPLSIVALVAGGGQQEGRVAIVASSDSDIHVAEDLAGKEVALSLNSSMDFAMDKMLQEYSIPLESVDRLSIPNIHLRMRMLLEGKVDAAVLPDPLIIYAQTQGARVILDDRDSGYSCLIIAMREDIMKKREDAIERFLIAYNRAVVDINVRPARFRSNLLAVAGLSDDIADVVRVHRFAHWRVPTRGQVAEVLAWLHLRRLVTEDCPYEHLVNNEFVHREDLRCADVWQEVRKSGKMVALRPAAPL